MGSTSKIHANRPVCTERSPVRLYSAMSCHSNLPRRRLCGFKHLAQVITGVTFKDGIEAETVDQIAA